MSHMSLNIVPDTYVEFNKHLLNERMNEWESAGDLGGTESNCLPLQTHTGAHQTWVSKAESPETPALKGQALKLRKRGREGI